MVDKVEPPAAPAPSAPSGLIQKIEHLHKLSTKTLIIGAIVVVIAILIVRSIFRFVF